VGGGGAATERRATAGLGALALVARACWFAEGAAGWLSNGAPFIISRMRRASPGSSVVKRVAVRHLCLLCCNG